MAFTPFKQSIPQPTDQFNVSQGDLLSNNTTLNGQFAVEHDALNLSSPTGKHKYITLRQNPSLPVPSGTDIELKQGASSGRWVLEVIDSLAVYRQIPLRTTIANISISGSSPVNLVNFATTPIPNVGANSAGTVFIFDQNHQNRSVFSTFVYIGGKIYIPGGEAQLISGTHLTGFTSSGSVLQATTDGGSYTVTLVITESSIK